MVALGSNEMIDGRSSGGGEIARGACPLAIFGPSVDRLEQTTTKTWAGERESSQLARFASACPLC
jgi:hypothetical protein